jgi:hypothetical protein
MRTTLPPRACRSAVNNTLAAIERRSLYTRHSMVPTSVGEHGDAAVAGGGRELQPVLVRRPAHRVDGGGVLLPGQDAHPLPRRDLPLHQHAPVIAAGRQQRPELRVAPRHLPHGALVTARRAVDLGVNSRQQAHTSAAAAAGRRHSLNAASPRQLRRLHCLVSRDIVHLDEAVAAAGRKLAAIVVQLGVVLRDRERGRPTCVAGRLAIEVLGRSPHAGMARP